MRKAPEAADDFGMLDGVVQITEADEFAYQEMIAHVPLLAHAAARRVLIIGAGDGGVLRRVLAHRGVEQATMVEIDAEVVRLAREHLPAIGGAAWDDPRARVLIADGIAHVREAEAGSYDVIIVDSTDPVGVGEVLFTDAFYADSARLVGPRGIVVSQCGVPFMQAEELRTTTARRARHFADASAYLAAVPTYVGGFMTLGWSAQDPSFKCLSPLSVLQRIRELCEADDYDFLKETPQNGYHDHRGYVDVVRDRWLDRVDDEFRRSTGLVEETQYLELFDKYVTHVSNWVKRERAYNPVTGQYEEADVKLMENVEQMLGVVRNNDSFRRDLISAVAAHALDHPGERVSYPRLFPRYIQQVREATYGKRKKQLEEIARDVLATVNSETAHLDAERKERARGTIERLERDGGYAEPSIHDAIGELLRRRYLT